MRNFFFLLILALIVMVGLAPKICSTSLGKPFFLKAARAKFDGDVEVGSMQLTWLGPQKFKKVLFTYSDLDCYLEEFEIEAPFWSFSGVFQLKKAQLFYQKRPIQSFSGKVDGNEFEFFGENVTGHISLKGTAYSKLHFNVLLDVEQLPFMIINQRLQEVLGRKLDLFGTLSFNGDQGELNLTLKTDQLETKLIGNLTPQELTLREPLIAHLYVTEKMSRALFQDAGPLFLNSISNVDPIALRIEPVGFSLPFFSSIEKLKVGKATLDLGRCKCQNRQGLATLIGVLKRDFEANYKEMRAWFTPLEFSVENGILQTSRMDVLLADTIHVCTWGKIDLVKDRLDMTLGLTEETLRRSFKLKNLPEDYVLTMDVRGKTWAPEFINAPAAAKITTLVGIKKLEKRGVLGPLASIFSTPKIEEDIPEPVRPYPWE